MRAKNRPSAQSEQYRARVDVIQKQIRNCTDAICQGNSYPSLMEKLSELEQELADAKAKLANYSPGTIRIQLRETRRFVDFRFRYLQSVLDGEPRLARRDHEARAENHHDTRRENLYCVGKLGLAGKCGC